ncbi:MAG: hypothetical protein M1821_004504 [Bathelium mastoideum]|nr:MAG: hypothetical protein M1821_004504 [Bathelium mastoideum]
MAVLNLKSFDTNSACTNGTNYTSPNAAEFEISCNTDIPTAANLVTHHVQNLTACTDLCATYTNSSGVTCHGAVFDSTLENGYQNCYLKSQLASTIISNGFHYVQLTRAANGSATNSDPSHHSSSSSSHAWIAGPVVGGIVGLAAIAGVLFWLQRRRRRAQSTHYDLAPLSQASPGSTDQGSLPGNGTIKPAADAQYRDQAGTGIPAMQQQQVPLELDNERPKVELAGNPIIPELPEQRDDLSTSTAEH